MRLQPGRRDYSLQAKLGQRVDDRQQADSQHRGAAWVCVPALDLLVDVQGAVPAAVDEYGNKETGDRVAFPAYAGQAEPALRDGIRARVMPEDRDQARDGQADEDQVFNERDADLGAGGDANPGDRDHQHDQADRAADADPRPAIGRVRAEHREDRRPEQQDLGNGPDDVGNHHQPASEEAQVRIDRAANPFE